MNLQYINDSQGNPTGVFIPIEEWISLKQKYNVLQQEELQTSEIPDWHKKILDERLEDYRKNPDINMDFNEVLKDIRKKYSL